MPRTIITSVATFSNKRASTCLLGRENERVLYSRPAINLRKRTLDSIQPSELDLTRRRHWNLWVSCRGLTPEYPQRPHRVLVDCHYLAGRHLCSQRRWRRPTSSVETGPKTGSGGSVPRCGAGLCLRNAPISIGFTYPAIPHGGFKSAAGTRSSGLGRIRRKTEALCPDGIELSQSNPASSGCADRRPTRMQMPTTDCNDMWPAQPQHSGIDPQMRPRLASPYLGVKAKGNDRDAMKSLLHSLRRPQLRTHDLW